MSAQRGQAAALVALEFDLDDVDLLTEKSRRKGEASSVLECHLERGELLGVAVGVHHDLLEQLVDIVVHRAQKIPERRLSRRGGCRSSSQVSGQVAAPGRHHSRCGRLRRRDDDPRLSQVRRLDSCDALDSVQRPLEGGNLGYAGALGAGDEVCLREVDAVGFVHLD